MFVSRSRSDTHQRRMKGAPLQKNTGVVSANCSQPESRGSIRRTRAGAAIPPIARKSTGRPRARATQKRGSRTRAAGSPM